jgi:uncharacterized protein YebE (UPF0316 family)
MTELLNSLPPIVVCFVVCFAKILEISVQSLKTVLMVKGQRVYASLLGFVEVMIWGLVISAVITTLGNDMWLLLFYCVGYATGLFLGSLLEEKLALGTVSLQIIANPKHTEKIGKYLTDRGNGYTVFNGHGAKSEANLIIIVVQRKHSKKMLAEIRELCNYEVFEMTSDVSRFVGGYGVSK